MPRFAFRLRVHEDRIADYDEAHRHVWPELLDVIKAAGISNYSIFRRGTELFFVMTADDFEASWEEICNSKVNARWQAAMAPLFDRPDRCDPHERFPMMSEVFHLD